MSGLLFALSSKGAAGPVQKRILFFTKSSGYEHSVIKKGDGGPSHAEAVLEKLAHQQGWEIVTTKDGRVFTNEGLAKYDAIFFFTTGDLTTPGTDTTPPMPPAGKAALLDAIRNGKGFIGAHSATDTFHGSGSRFARAGTATDPYLQMVGAEFIQHGQQQRARMICADPKFPGCAELSGGFELFEEWYSFKDYQPDLHVILVQDTTDMAKAGRDAVYARPPYPATWTRLHGKGRVFYTSMGHREDVWTNPVFQRILVGGIAWVLGDTHADVTPNLDRVAPGYAVIPPEM